MSLLVRSLATASAILVLGSGTPLFAQTAPDARKTGSLLGDVGRDYLRFFTTGETYVVLGVGLAASASVRPLDDPITRSAFNSELWFNEDSAVARHSKRETRLVVPSFRWAGHSRPTESGILSANRGSPRSDAIS